MSHNLFSPVQVCPHHICRDTCMSIRHVCTHVSSVPYYWSPSTPSTRALIRLQPHALAICIASRAITPLVGWMHAHMAPLGVAERVSVSPPGLIDVTSRCFPGWGPRDAWPLRSPVPRSGSPGTCSVFVCAVPAAVVDATPPCAIAAVYPSPPPFLQACNAALHGAHPFSIGAGGIAWVRTLARYCRLDEASPRRCLGPQDGSCPTLHGHPQVRTLASPLLCSATSCRP